MIQSFSEFVGNIRSSRETGKMQENAHKGEIVHPCPPCSSVTFPGLLSRLSSRPPCQFLGAPIFGGTRGVLCHGLQFFPGCSPSGATPPWPTGRFLQAGPRAGLGVWGEDLRLHGPQALSPTVLGAKSGQARQTANTAPWQSPG